LKDLRRHGYAAEDKWDGTRVKVEKKNGKVTLINRHGIDYTHRLPEFVEAAEAIKGDFTIDTEAVYVNPATGEIEFTPCQCLQEKECGPHAEAIPQSPAALDL